MKNKISLTMRTVILICVLLVVVGAALSIVLTTQAQKALRAQIRDRMLDITNVAAAQLDGDAVDVVRRQGKNCPEYEDTYNKLFVFYTHIKLSYIYIVAENENGDFVFIVDTDTDSPGEFGEPVAYTDALYAASRGTASVDDEPYEDIWGCFYSAYSPVFNSKGEVAGIVTADFSARWYEEAVAQLRHSALLVCIVSLLIAAAIVVILGGRLRRRLGTVNDDLRTLSDDLDALIREIPFFPHEQADAQPVETAPGKDVDVDEIGALDVQIRDMQQELRGYVAFARAQAYRDGLTGLSNQNAYFRRVQELNGEIEAKTAGFTVFVIDLNGLKNMNDDFGHDAGDAAILDSADVLRRAFPDGELFRIGGDEFAVLLPPCSEAEIAACIDAMDASLAACNETPKTYGAPLAFSKGAAVFDPEQDSEYKDVFRRADQAMYKDKAAFYARNGDRRRR